MRQPHGIYAARLMPNGQIWICHTLHGDRNPEGDATEERGHCVTAAAKRYGFAGSVGVVFISARFAWRKTSGECHVTGLPGNARTVAIITDSATNNPLIRTSRLE